MDDDRAELRSMRFTTFTGFMKSVGLVGLIIVTAGACAAQAEPEPYTYAFATKETAAQAVADALTSRDGDRLLAMAVTEREFRTRVWPALPASRPEVGMPADYLWADTLAKSRGHLAEILQTYGGRALTVQRVTFGGAAADYGSFRIHPKTSVTVRDEAGKTYWLRLLGSMIETNDGWKIFSYIVD